MSTCFSKRITHILINLSHCSTCLINIYSLLLTEHLHMIEHTGAQLHGRLWPKLLQELPYIRATLGPLLKLLCAPQKKGGHSRVPGQSWLGEKDTDWMRACSAVSRMPHPHNHGRRPDYLVPHKLRSPSPPKWDESQTVCCTGLLCTMLDDGDSRRGALIHGIWTCLGAGWAKQREAVSTPGKLQRVCLYWSESI